MRLLFIGHNGYGYPHTRVRCYHFAKILSGMPDIETAVLSFRDDLAPDRSEAAMYESLRDRDKLLLSVRAIGRLLKERDTILYIQKAHFHAAAPFFLHRLGWIPNYIFDYDDYDVPLSNFFGRGMWNRLFFGSSDWEVITRTMAHRARACVAASHALVDFLVQENDAVGYIPTGVDDRVFTPRNQDKESDTVTLLWNGLVWGEPILKNLRLLFNAFRSASHELKNAKLLLVGGGAEWNTVQRWLQEDYAGLPIECQSWVEPQEMPGIVRQADIGLLPQDGEDAWLRAKSPTKMFEYMASGLAVIASNIGEAGHIIDHLENGYLVRNEQELAGGIIRLVRSHALRKQLGMSARKTVEKNYSLPVLGESLYHFLQKVVSETGNAR